MKYLALEDYSKSWVFRHQALPLNESDLAQIKPLSVQAAGDVWRNYISAEGNHYENFHAADWPKKAETWQGDGNWQQVWESDDESLPAELLEFMDWQGETLIYFCYDHEQVIETRWSVFQRAWKNFLFFDDGPILVGRKRQQAVQFFQNGQFKFGNRL